MDSNQYKIESEKLKETIKIVENNIEETVMRLNNVYDICDDENVANMLYRQNAQKLSSLEKSKDSPYFARLDFKENGKDTSNLYIGKTGILNDTDVVVTDWRAPISSLYYDYALGDASYVCPEGKIDGEILLKRQFTIHSGKLENYMDVDAFSTDELLQDSLSENSDVRLKSIVATIQADQNKIIRSDINKTLIVQGVAGSGKTTVALHRIAYLAYTYFKKLRVEDYLIIAPNHFFLDYIAKSLPDLDIEDIRQETFEDFALGYIKLNYRVCDPNEDLNIIINGKEEGNILAEIESFKSKSEFKGIIDRYLKRFEFETFREVCSFKIKDNEIISKVRIQKFWKSLLEKSSLQDRLNLLRDMLTNTLQDIIVANDNGYKWKERDFKTSEIEDIRKNGKKYINQYIKSIKLFSAVEHFGNIINTIDNYNTSLSNSAKEKIKELYNKRIKARMVTYEDLAGLMYIQYKVFGVDREKMPKYVVVDEAQDFGDFQFYILKKILKTSAMTILGDMAQGIYSYRGMNSWQRVADNVFLGKADIIQLAKSYRTTIEIMNEANKVASNMKKDVEINLAVPVIRHGSEVTYSKFDNEKGELEELSRRIAELKKQGMKNVAVIAKNFEESKRIYEEIKDKRDYDMTLLGLESSSYQGEVSILSSYLSKGLEFDAVIIVDASDEVYKNSILDAKLLYIAMTRAMHKLDVFYVGNRSSLFEQC